MTEITLLPEYVLYPEPNLTTLAQRNEEHKTDITQILANAALLLTNPQAIAELV